MVVRSCFALPSPLFLTNISFRSPPRSSEVRSTTDVCSSIPRELSSFGLHIHSVPRVHLTVPPRFARFHCSMSTRTPRISLFDRLVPRLSHSDILVVSTYCTHFVPHFPLNCPSNDSFLVVFGPISLQMRSSVVHRAVFAPVFRSSELIFSQFENIPVPTSKSPTNLKSSTNFNMKEINSRSSDQFLGPDE